MKNTYIIPIEYFDLMNERLKKLNKKAEKLNIKPIRIEILNTVMHEVEGIDAEIPSYEVEIEQEEDIIINGYEFMGKLEKNIEDTYIYKGKEGVPREQKEKITCQHCNTNRIRKFYYILKNESTGEFITVGKTCLKDFTGHSDAEKIAKFYQDVKIFIEEYYKDCFKEYYSGRYEPTIYPIDQVIRASIISIKNRGYFKSNSENGVPTKVDVENIIRVSYGGGTKADENDYEKSKQIPQREIDEIKNVIKSLEPTTDFIENLQLLIKDGFVRETMLGYAVYIPVAVEREKEKRLKDEFIKKSNSKLSYIGEIGEKINVLTKFYNYSYYDRLSAYTGMLERCNIYTFLDENGNRIVWKTTSREDFEVGDEVMIKGKVKSHSEYNGAKQTVITRPTYKFLCGNYKSKYLGNIGDKLEIEVTCLNIVEEKISLYEDKEFTRYKYEFLDKKKNCVVWISKEKQNIDINDKVKILGKVKDYSKYKGTKQTVIYKVKIQD